jgi:CheY-like chemotaxis protein
LLRTDGHTVYVAGDGAEALRIASERSLDALVLDLDMPDMSGNDVARHLRSNGIISRQTKLIALTGFTRTADRLDALAAGFDHHLNKPVDVEALEAILSANGSAA